MGICLSHWKPSAAQRTPSRLSEVERGCSADTQRSGRFEFPSRRPGTLGGHRIPIYAVRQRHRYPLWSVIQAEFPYGPRTGYRQLAAKRSFPDLKPNARAFLFARAVHAQEPQDGRYGPCQPPRANQRGLQRRICNQRWQES